MFAPTMIGTKRPASRSAARCGSLKPVVQISSGVRRSMATGRSDMVAEAAL
jgi:hypothetical protein